MTCVDFIQVIILTFLEGIVVQSCITAVNLQVMGNILTGPLLRLKLLISINQVKFV